MQVMPQLINHLGVDASDPSSPDWGTIAVYTCAASCGGGSGGGSGGGEGEAASRSDGGGGGSGGGWQVGEVDPGADEDSAYVEEYVFVQPSP